MCKYKSNKQIAKNNYLNTISQIILIFGKCNTILYQK